MDETWSRCLRRVRPRARPRPRICAARFRPLSGDIRTGPGEPFRLSLGPWSRAAQTFIRWARLGVWERLLLLAQERGVQLGMTFLDGTSIRAHHKAAGAEKEGANSRGSR